MTHRCELIAGHEDDAWREKNDAGTGKRPEDRRLPTIDERTTGKYGGKFFGHFIGHFLSTLVGKLIVGALIALVAYLSAAAVGHLDPFKQHMTITSSAVLAKLTKIEQLHVVTGSCKVNVSITQSVWEIPCFIWCNHLQLVGTGTGDAIVDLSKLSPSVDLSKLSLSDVNLSPATASATVWVPAPVIGPADLDIASCDVTGNGGIINDMTRDFHNNPNAAKPVYLLADAQIHNEAEHDKKLLAAGEQSTRQTLARLLGAMGVKHVTVNFT